MYASINDQYYNAVNKFDMELSVFGRAKTSLSLAMRVLVVNNFMCTLFSYPNRHFFMLRVLLQEVQRKALRFLTRITWTKLGMFSAVGALYGTQLPLQDLRMSNVASVLFTHETWVGIRRGTISTLSRWRRQHIFLPNSAISWKVAFDFFRHTVGSTHSDVKIEAGQRRSVRPFSFLYQRMAGAELQRWETYLERRVQAKGWGGPMMRRALRHLPRSVPQAHRCFFVEGTPQCSHRICKAGRSAGR